MNGLFERGEVYWVRMDSGLGTEQGVGRPGVILTNNENNRTQSVVTIAFLSRKYHPGQKYVEVYATGEKSYVICHQVMTYDKSRLGKYCGKLNAAEQKAVDDAIEEVFDLGYENEAALKAKDAEIEARDAVIAEKDSEIQSLKDRMKNLEAGHADEVAGLKIELTVYQKLYERSLDYAADVKFAADLARRTPVAEVSEVAEEQPVVEEEQPEEETPEVETELVDINSATITALKKLGFSLPMAKKIKEGRPYSSVDDLKRVNGLKANMLRIVEPKLCCNPVEPVVEAEVVVVEETVAEEQPVVEKDHDPGFELLDINTLTARDLIDLGMYESAAYTITGYRNKNGFFNSVEDLLNVPRVSKSLLDRFREYLTCVPKKLNINEATQEELTEVGFSEVMAGRIVAYRDKNGPFAAVHDLLKVEGMTGKTVQGVGDKVGV